MKSEQKEDAGISEQVINIFSVIKSAKDKK
jgi:hypothetical protein